MGFPSFTDVLTGLSMHATLRGAQAMPGVAATIDSTSGFSRAAVEVFDAVSGTDTVGWAEDYVARARGGAGRAELESAYGIAASGFTGGFEPPSVSVMDYFENMSHAEIVEFVEAMTPARMRESVDGWSRAQVFLGENLDVFREAIATVFAEHWTGTTASAAGRGVADYSTSLTQLTSALSLVTNSLDYASVGIEQVKQRLPAPPEFTWADGLRTAMSVIAPPKISLEVHRLLHEEEEAKAAAVRIMKEDYEPTVTTSDSRVPVLPPAFDPTVAGNAGSSGYPGAGGGTGSLGAGGGNRGASYGSTGPSETYGISGGGPWGTDDPAGSTAGPGGTPGLGEYENSVGQNSRSSGDDSPGSARTAAASVDPASALPASTSGGSGSATPGSGGSVGGGPSGGASSGGGSSGPGAPGATPPGFAPGTAVAAPASGAASGAARGTGRMAPMPMGMMPPGARSGDDEKRSVPGYLVTEEHGNELIGTIPATTPPVLGA